MEKQYVYTVEDFEAILTGALQEPLFDQLDEDDFAQIQQALQLSGTQYVFVDDYTTIQGEDEGELPIALQVIKTVTHNYSVFYYTMLDGFVVQMNLTTKEALQQVGHYVNTMAMIEPEQLARLNALIHWLYKGE